MCSVDSISKIAKYLKVNPGKVSYNSDKVVTTTLKTGTLTGFSTILQRLQSESKEPCTQKINNNLELQCLVSQWIDYSVLFVNPSHRDRQVAKAMLTELNNYLSTRSYLVGNYLTVADLAVFFTIHDTMQSLSSSDKEQYLNVSRWFDHFQQQKPILQGNPTVNLSAIHLNR